MWRISTGRSSYHLSYGGQMLLQIGEHLAGLLLRSEAREFDSSPAHFAFETKVIPPFLYAPRKFGALLYRILRHALPAENAPANCQIFSIKFDDLLTTQQVQKRENCREQDKRFCNEMQYRAVCISDFVPDTPGKPSRF